MIKNNQNKSDSKIIANDRNVLINKISGVMSQRNIITLLFISA